MGTKVKRTPLFGHDGNLGIPVIARDGKPLTMEVGVTGVYRDPAPPATRRLGKALTSAPGTPSKTVNFSASQDTEKKREKFLTAKYGAHQMALIRKRLRVEMWMYDQLQTLYTTEDESSADVEIDLDEVLDIEGDNLRKKFIFDILTNSKSSRESITTFVDDLLERAKTL